MSELNDLCVIVRAAGERTADFCCAELARQSGLPVDRIELVPFWKTLQAGLEHGQASGAKWVLSVDADVIPAPEMVSSAIQWTEKAADDVGVLTGMVQCKFFASARFMAVRVYRASVIPDMLARVAVNFNERRPESHSIKELAGPGWKNDCVPDIVGLHDYEQYYGDIYRKCFLHAHKHLGFVPDFVRLWRDRSKNDLDFMVALRGLADGIASVSEVLCDASSPEFAKANFLSELGLTEKTVFEAGDISVWEEIEKTRLEVLRGDYIPLGVKEQRLLDKQERGAELKQRVEWLCGSVQALAEQDETILPEVIHRLAVSAGPTEISGLFSANELFRALQKKVIARVGGVLRPLKNENE